MPAQRLGIILHIADRSHVFDPFADKLNMPNEHRGAGVHSLFMGHAHHAQPVITAALADTNTPPDARRENFTTAAGNRIQTGRLEPTDDFAHIHRKKTFKFDEFRRAESVNMHRGKLGLDIAQQVFVVGDGQISIHPPLHQNLRTVNIDQLLDFGANGSVIQHIAVRVIRITSKRAKRATRGADIGIIDISVDYEGAVVFGMLAQRHLIGPVAQIMQRGLMIQFHRLLLGKPGFCLYDRIDIKRQFAHGIGGILNYPPRSRKTRLHYFSVFEIPLQTMSGWIHCTIRILILKENFVMAEQPKQKLATMAIHAGQVVDPATNCRTVPIYATTSFVFNNTEHAANLFGLKEFGNIYTRLQNPTTDVMEKRLAALDGGVAGLGFASGMAATNAAILTLCHAGQNFISATSLYGGTWTLFTQTFKNLGIEVRFFDPNHPEQIDKLVDENTRCVFFEALGNPKNDVPDFKKIADIAHKHGLPAICDNTVMTPMLLRPIEHGIDIVTYAVTKFIGGHGTHIGGAIVDSGKFKWADNPKKWPEFCAPSPSYHGMIFEEALRPIGNIAYIVHIRTHWLRDTGAAMSPFAAFLFLQGLETLHLRMPRHCENALGIARWLSKHPLVSWVNYPGLESHKDHAMAVKYLPNGAGAIMGFGIKGGYKSAVKFIDSVKLLSHLANIGDAKTLVIHPASTTHSQLSEEEQARAGVSPDYIRLSIGLEDIDDIKADIDQALKAAQ